MKFTCDRDTIVEAASHISRVVSQKTAVTALSGILFTADRGQVTLCGYDLEIGMETAIDALVEECGKIILEAKLFCDIVRRLPEDKITVYIDERLICHITSGNSKFSLVGINPDEYPELPQVLGVQNLSIPSAILTSMVRQTIFSCAVPGNSKPVHTGIMFEVEDGILRLIAVDGFRIAVRQENINFEGQMRFIVPARTLSEVLRLITTEDDIKICMTKRHIIFTVDGYFIISRLLDGDFFNYERILPEELCTTAVADVRMIIDTVERVSQVITDKERRRTPITCKLSDNTIKCTCSTDVGSASDEVPLDIEGRSLSIGFNFRYLLEALRATESDKCALQFEGEDKPLLIRPIDGDTYLYIVLPVRMK